MGFEAIVHEYDLRCGAEQAFEVYVAGQWWHPKYTPDPGSFEKLTIGPESVVLTHRGLGEFVIGQVVESSPPSRLVYTSTLAQTPEWPSEITVAFTPGADGCHIGFEHGGWNDGNAADRKKFSDWPEILDRFVALADSVGGS
ncbi:hypothetical protein GCM10009744_02880 [Kribbella alba]|uniref:Activator of Hsp90 ATPase homologue 1/2-like C-terminal domain-containing protein n=1 Tax=Kribbella alba TaxID=190197 RepID=A0ABN2EYW2_9ACTN